MFEIAFVVEVVVIVVAVVSKIGHRLKTKSQLKYKYPVSVCTKINSTFAISF